MKIPVERVAISLPRELLEAAERERELSGETRSQLFRRALEALLRSQRERAATQRYVSGYTQQPETVEEVAATHSLGVRALAEDTWE